MSSGGASSSSPADNAMPCDQAGPGSSPDNPVEVVDSPRAGSKRRLETVAPAPSTKAKVVIEISDTEDDSESESESGSDDEWQGFGVGPTCFPGKCPACKGTGVMYGEACDECICGATGAMTYCGHCKCQCFD